eukprot:gb/GECG01015328.1/.p1 GENE.gb/GECG01015328.1/~~gb/GECG01015328.1/.p1  ORF type:complete len:180 (+),score=18.50 gb/GECG01015328.1/:1-540(+)
MENWREPTKEDRLDDPDIDGIVQLRRYDKQKRIGTGAFSHVFQHYDKEESKSCAVKRCHYGRVKEGVPAIALKEVRMLKSLSFSPYVVSLQDVFFHKGRLHMVIDYAPRTLQDVLDAENSISINFVQHVFCQVLFALRNCHQSGILHRVSIKNVGDEENERHLSYENAGFETKQCPASR